MKKLGMVKIILVGVMALTLIFGATTVFAADDGFSDLTSTLNSTNGTNSNGTNTNSNTNATNTNTNSNATNTNSNTSLTTTNSSSYNNTTSLPSTGIEDSLPTVVLIVVLIISAIYAYKKIKDYQNI